MRAALLCVVALGAAIGFLVPRTPRATPSVVAAAPAPVTVERPRETVLTRSDNGHFIAVAEVNRAPVRFVVDTGASTIALTQDDARRARIAFDPARFRVIGRGAGGAVRGQEITLDLVELDGKRAMALRGVVLEKGAVSLLGQSYLATLRSVEIGGDAMRLRP